MAFHRRYQMGDGESPELFPTIGQVRSVSGPTTKADIVDVTTHSTAGNWREKLAVLIDPGEVSFPINFDMEDATHNFLTGLWEDLVGLAKRNYKIVFPNAAGVLSFAAYVANHAFSAPVDNVLSADITLAITGEILATES